MAILQKPKPLTNEQKLAARRAELDYFAQVEAERKEREATKRAERDDFVQRAKASREEFAKAQALGLQWVPDEPIGTLDGYYKGQAAEEAKAKAEAEAARIAALTPRQLWFSTLSWQDQQKVQTYEKVNRIPYPVPGLD